MRKGTSDNNKRKAV